MRYIRLVEEEVLHAAFSLRHDSIHPCLPQCPKLYLSVLSPPIQRTAWKESIDSPLEDQHFFKGILYEPVLVQDQGEPRGAMTEMVVLDADENNYR